MPFSGLDFSVNANPYGPNPALLQAVLSADHARYPDPTYHSVRASLGRWHGVPAECVVPAVGASELLHRVVRAYLRSGERALSVLAPFGEYARAVTLAGGRLDVVTPRGAVGAAVSGVKLVYLGHPHNPTGRVMPDADLAALILACQRADALLILDLAYAPFLGLPDLPLGETVVALHSPGKAHGLVGARPAYAVAPCDVAAALQNLAPAWTLPSGTAALLEAVPDAQDFLQQTGPNVAREAARLARQLSALGEVEHHGTPYLTVRVGDAARTAAALLARGLKVRDCASYLQPEHLRVSTRGPADDRQLVRTMRALLGGGGQTT